MSNPARFLGFAFTNADFLFEVDAKGTIVFAAGAANDLVRENGDTLVGTPVGKLFNPSEATKFATFTKALKGGERAGPFQLTLATGAQANLAMLRLSENGSNISCTLARPSRPAIDSATGLASRDGFMAAARTAGGSDILTLVNVPGLPELCAQLPGDKAQLLMQRIGASLQTAGITAAGRISETGFGALSPAMRGDLGLARKVAEAISADGLKAPRVSEMRLGLQATELSDEQRLLAMRYVIDRFAEKGKFDSSDVDLASIFTKMMEETQRRLGDITRKVGEGAFEIAYQPICELETGKVSHYEALARFDNPEGTGETVKFIEALGISDAFDLMVANKVMGVIEDRSDVHIAFNISGATIASPASFGLLAGMLARRRKLAPRTLIEITETSAIADLESAGKAIQALRSMGFRVGLDDFGAGAASVNYLHAFAVDFVKFDGAMIQKIGSPAHDDAFLQGLAKLCAEMQIDTIAEWIETEAQAKAVAAMGFHHGQGKWFGAPVTEIPSAAVGPGKRRGVTESWG